MLSTLIMSLALLTPGGDATVVLRCKSEAQVRGTDVRLADLAEIKAEDTALIARLAEVSFGQRPGFGYSRQITRNDIVLRLAREGLSVDDLQILGADAVIVQPLFREVGTDELLEAAAPVLRAVLEQSGETADYEIDPSPAPKLVRLPPGRRSFDIAARVRDNRVQSTSAIVDVHFLIDGEEHKTLPIAFKIRRYHAVLATTKAIRKGETLGEHNLTVRRIEAAYGTSHFVTELEQVRGQVAARDLPASEQLSSGAVAAPAVIQKGDQVSLIVSRGRIKVATRAIAQENGSVGEHIMVANLTSGQVLQATVVSHCVVTIQPIR